MAKAPAKKSMKPRKPLKPDKDGVVRLSGGNPQIAKGDGDEVVQDFIKAVKWNTPLYGFGDGTWFLAFHVYAKYIKVTFFRGEGMKPVPPEASKVRGVRYLHVREGEFDEKQFADWVKQASKLPGEKM
mgnify:CR=1 FL=1